MQRCDFWGHIDITFWGIKCPKAPHFVGVNNHFAICAKYLNFCNIKITKAVQTKIYTVIKLLNTGV